MKRFGLIQSTGIRMGFFVMALLISSCGDGGGGGGGGGTPAVGTFTNIWTGIIQVSCLGSGCHSTGGDGADQTGLDMMTQDLAHLNLLGVMGLGEPSSEVPSILRVAPGDPDNSYIIDKLECTADVAATTFCMPLSFPFVSLDAAEIDEIRLWITNGGLND